MPEQASNRRRMPRRPLVPHFHAPQTDSRTRRNQTSVPPPPEPSPPPPPPPAPPPVPPQELPLPDIPALLGDLKGRLARLDGETLLLLAILWMLWQEKADRRLLLALVYILL